MKKKFLLYVLPLLGMALTSCGKTEPDKPDDPGKKEDQTTYDVVVNSKVGIEEKEGGYLHQLRYEDQVIDIVGYEENGGKVGSIKRATYGDGYTYNGMIYNRSLFANLDKIRVDFSGGDLQYVFTEFLMEDMNFDAKKNNKLVSGEPVSVPAGKGYFVLYTKSTTPVKIDAVKLKLNTTGFDAKMIYTKDTVRGGARSNGVELAVENSYIQLQNNPTQWTNNYSGSGKHDGHTNADSWYRWNGRYFSQSEDLGTEFTFGMTIAGEYRKMVNEEENFHYNIWPQFSYGNAEDEPWVQTYIGNDNYEPLGKDAALRPSDPYSQEAYAGRFFGNYDWYNAEGIVDYDDETGAWKFGDPDVAKIPDGTKTLREAYEENNLPFWFIKTHVYLGEGDVPWADVFINGTKVYSLEIFYEYDSVEKPSIHLRTLPMHLVNYGVDAEGTPDEAYTGCFTYPRLMD